MKKSLLLSVVFGSYLFCNPIFSQNNQTSGSLGLPGDNLNLYGVLNIFQESKTLEEFEQKLNAEDSKINNLDLDGDGKTDYIKVIDNVSGNAHYIVLQDAINEKESQDVAVIEVEKDNNNQIQIQIIGDMLLYGKDYIVEPANGTPNPGYTGENNANYSNDGKTTVINNYYNTNEVGSGSAFVYMIGAWSIIHFIYAPAYVVYVSPWRWGYYPSYWHTWHPIYYYDYYSHWHHHPSYGYFRQSHSYHVTNAHQHYGPMRSSSPVVHQRIEKGEYNKTYNRVNAGSENNVRPQNNNGQPKQDYNKSSSVRSSTPKAATPNNSVKTNSSARPAASPNARPASSPAAKPAVSPNARPAESPSARPASKPAVSPNARPASKPAASPNVRPAESPSAKPASKPVASPNAKPAERQVHHGNSERKD
jgi:hypothetical protein